MMSRPSKRVRIRDPIHGTLRFDEDELQVIDHRAVQRLRFIKQLGLADLAFPGATHTRYVHALGTTHIATRMFETVSRNHTLSPEDRTRLRSTLRLAALFHDLGHAPLSHTTERFMPPVDALELGAWAAGGRRASHEDFTLKILLDSDLTQLIRERFGPRGVRPEDIALLLSNRPPSRYRERFILGSLNWLPILRQCVSSELDADRMDYLLRDSYYAGVPYGRYDLDWLIENLRAVQRGRDLHLALHARATFGFEDYLLSRYHMFLSVYLHHVPVGYELMFKRYQEEREGELAFPADVDAYLECDDIFLRSRLKDSSNVWAQRIIRRQAYRMLFEQREILDDGVEETGSAVEDLMESLRAADIPAISHGVKGKLSKYFTPSASRPPVSTEPELFVLDEHGNVQPIETYSPLYRRYAGSVVLRRIYVDPDHLASARRLMGGADE
ncbi:MAG: HD domain-containing protein [Myxococcota bacterium]